MTPFILFILAVNYVSFGSFLKTGYSDSFTGLTHFDPKYFWDNLIHYGVSLNLVYPLMSLGVFFAVKTRRIEILTGMGLLAGLYSFNLFYDKFGGFLTTRVFGTRYFFPVIPFFILSYAECLEKGSERLGGTLRKVLAVTVILLLAAGAGVIHEQHQNHLIKHRKLQDAVYASTPEGSVLIYEYNSAELLSKGREPRHYLPYYEYPDFYTRLAEKDRSKGVFFINRTILYADKERVPGLPPEQMEDLHKRFNFSPVFETDGLKVIKLTEKSKETL